MKRVALGLAVVGIVCLAGDQSHGQPVVSRATAIQVAAGHGIQTDVSIGRMPQFQQVGLHGHGYYGGYYGHRGYRGYGPAFAYPRAWHYPAVVIPAPRFVPVVPPPVYRGPAYYYGPQYGFGYRSPDFSFGFSF